MCLFLSLFSFAASRRALLNGTCAMESPISCVSTASSLDENFAHNIWKPLELLFHVQICVIFEPFVDETDLARIALSCHLVSICSVTWKVLTIPFNALGAPLPVVRVYFGTAPLPLM